MIIAGKAASLIQEHHGLVLDKLYAGTFVTSLEKNGISISIIRSDPYIFRWMVCKTSAPFWPSSDNGYLQKIVIPAIISDSPLVSFIRKVLENLNNKGVSWIKEIVKSVATEAMVLKERLDEFDQLVGGGDCGTNVSLALSS